VHLAFIQAGLEKFNCPATFSPRRWDCFVEIEVYRDGFLLESEISRMSTSARSTRRIASKSAFFTRKALFAAALVMVSAIAGLAAFGPQSLSLTRLFAGAGAAAPSFKEVEPQFHAEAPAPMSMTSASLATARSGHTATVLADGRVLIVGGSGDTSAEIYDNGTVSTANNTNHARTGHTATLLPDGRVLIAGGGNTESEFYNPATGAFDLGPNMTVARSGHTATALNDGTVIITGGGTNTVEVFNGTSFEAAGALTQARTNHSAALMNDGRVFIAGGTGSATAEIYNPADGGSSAATGNPLAHERARAHLRVLPDGKVQIIGGNDDVSMEVYYPAIDTVGAHVHLLPDTDTCTGLRNGVRDSQTRAALFFAGNADAEYDRTGHTITEISGNQALVIGGTTGGSASNSVTTFASSPATITTDKLDYAPGETVTFSGTGFAPGETVRVVIHEDPHTHLERNFEATADASGNITGSYLVEEHDLNVKFIVNARGLTSNLTAQTGFTDSNPQAVTVALPQSVTVTQGNTASYGTVTVTRTGNSNPCLVTLSIISGGGTGLPSGTNPVWGTNPVTVNAAAPTTSFSVTTSTSTPTGTYTFRIRGTKDGFGCEGGPNAPSDSQLLTLTVNPQVPSRLNFGVQPSNTNKDATISPAVTVRIEDASGNLVTSSTRAVTLTIGANPAGGTLTGTLTKNAVGGIATFNDLKINNAGNGYTLVASSALPAPALTSDTSSAFNINKLNQTITVTTPAPASATYGQSFNVAATGGASGNNVVITTSGGCSGGGNNSATITMTSGTTACNVQYNQAGNANYNDATEVTSSTTAQKATLTVTASSHTVTFGDAAPAISPSYSGFVAGDDENDLTTQPTCSTTYTQGADVAGGPYISICDGGISSNYDFNYPIGTVDVTPATASITVNGYSVQYDGLPHGLSGTATGVGGADLSSFLSFGPAVTDVPGGSITWSFDAGTNYNTANGSAMVTITQAPSTTTVSCPASVPYNSEAQEPCTFTVTGGTLNIGPLPVPSGGYANNINVGQATASYAYPGDSNHQPSTLASDTFDITAIALTINGAIAENKVYNGDNVATVSFDDAELVTPILGDDVTIDSSGYTASFDTADVGDDKPVTVAGVVLAGADKDNYTLSQPTGLTADITKKQLTLVGAIAADKPYDGGFAAEVNFGAATLVGVEDDDTVGYDPDNYVASFTTKDVGTDIIVSVTDVFLTDPDSANYELELPIILAADITPRALVASFTAENKVYDGGIAATIATQSLATVVTDEDVTLSLTNVEFSDKNAANGKTVTADVTIGGADSGNYTVNSTASTTADITPKPITGNFTAADKVYDGNLSATVLTRTLNDTIGGDVISLTGGTAAFDTKNVGTDKVVTLSGAVLSGGDAGNYSLTSVGTTLADITPATVTGSFTADSKVYDGNANATMLTRTIDTGIISPDVVTLEGGTATFDNKNVGIGKTVTGAGFTLGGADAGNYQLASTTLETTANITALNITGSFTSANKVYDGNDSATILTRSLAGTVGGDDVSLSGGSATFSDKNVANGKTVTGTGFVLEGGDADNYNLTGVSTTTADITPRTLNVTATGIDKEYDGNTSATVNLSDDRVSGDDLIVVYASASFTDKNVGTDKPVNVSGISISSGTDQDNYLLGSSTAAATADITQRSLTVTADADDKVYDGNTTAVATLADNRVSGDVFTAEYTAADFDDKHVATGKTVTVSGISISGTDAGNYTLTNTVANATADITPRPITVSAVTDTKTYDGNTSSNETPDFSQLVGDDTGSGTQEFDSRNAGSRTLSVVSITITDGNEGNNYSVSYATASGSISALAIALNAVTDTKEYDGGTSSTLSPQFVTLISPDSGTATQEFDSKNVGPARILSVTGYTINDGNGGNNYTVTTNTAAGSITAKAITISIAAEDKVYDGADSADFSCSISGEVSGDDVDCTGGTATFASEDVGTHLVTATGLSLEGADAGNYTFNSTATDSAEITALALVASIVADNKVYDGDADATFTCSLATIVPGDDVTCTGTTAEFASKNVGTHTVTATGLGLGGADAGNYSLPVTTATDDAEITVLAITVQAVTDTKVYDGTTDSNVEPEFVTLASGDTATATQVFDSKNAGARTLSVVSSRVVIDDDNGGNNYSVTLATATGTITQKPLTASIAANDKVYDTTTTATFTCSLSGIVSPDVVNCTGTTANFASANVGTWTVTATGLGIAGADSANYSVNTSATDTADITPAGLTITALDKSKIFGTTYTFDMTTPSPDFSVIGLLGSDSVVSVTLSSTGAPALAPAGSHPILVSAAVGSGLTNYTITYVPGTIVITGYLFDGFRTPIDNSTLTTKVWNTVNAGQAIPAKWRLTLAAIPVSTPSSFVDLMSFEVSCSTGAGDIETAVEEVASGASGLLYHGDGNWQYNWKTPKNYAKKCRAMYVLFNDGSMSPLTYFKFK
jgi:hypothetical protein